MGINKWGCHTFAGCDYPKGRFVGYALFGCLDNVAGPYRRPGIQESAFSQLRHAAREQ